MQVEDLIREANEEARRSAQMLGLALWAAMLICFCAAGAAAAYLLSL